MINRQLAIPAGRLQAFCQGYAVAKLSLFGSVLRDDFGPESDIDVLVEFLPDAHPTYFDLFHMKQELSQLFGREVDLLTPNALSDYFREDVLDKAEVVYEAERSQ